MKTISLSIGVVVCTIASLSHAATSTQGAQQQQQQSSSYSTHTARRERNLDHWDAETLIYYLGIDETTGKVSPSHEYPGHDVAIMFYAQWCQNCHALAPSWDAIATHLRAGSKSSKLIMALFDCELNRRHMALCTAAGVQHYPTLMFVGDGTYHDTDIVTRTILGKKSAGRAGPSPIPHTVKFQGQWQFPDAILDWIRVMQGLSRWHRWTSQGFLRYIRNGLLGFLRKTTPKKTTVQSLPVGIPTSGGGGGDAAQTSMLTSKLEQTQKEGKLMEKAATHAGLLLDAILFPPTFQNKTSDVFQVMKETNAWNKTTPFQKVLRSCTLELSLDYCTRLSTHVTNEYIDEITNLTDIPSMEVIESLLKNRTEAKEPFCIQFDACLLEDFKTEKCQPPTCPFQEVGCRYTSACLESTIQTEYAIALELIKEGETFKAEPSVPPQPEVPPAPKKKKAWGF